MTTLPPADPDNTATPPSAPSSRLQAPAPGGFPPVREDTAQTEKTRADTGETDAEDGAAPTPASAPPAAARGGEPVHGSTGHQPPRADAQPSVPDRDPGLGAREDDGRHTSAPAVQQNVPVNLGTVIGTQNISEIRRLRGTPLPKDWIEDRLASYLPDSQLTDAISGILKNNRVAVLHGLPGTGRYSTALHTLTRQSAVTAIRQVRREPNDAVDLEGLTDEDTGWILDLRDEEETLHTGFGLHLREAEGHLSATRSLVIVVTHTDTWACVASEATELARPVAPPVALNALRAHLNCPQPGIDELEQWLAQDAIVTEMEGASPATAAHWARIIRTTAAFNSSSTDPKSVPELVDAVVQAARNWRHTLRTWHTCNTDSTHRNYLLAAATLDGAPAEDIYEAHTTLGKILGDTPQPTRGQQGPGIIELTHTIGAELGSDDRVRFLNPGYAEAVVDYFWVDRPHHVAAFTRWTAEQAATLPPDLGDPLAERVTQWATHYTIAKQSFTVLRAIATDWAKNPRLHDRAQDLLVAAAVDPTDGKRARDQYLTWAKAPDTDDPSNRKHIPLALKRALAGALAQLAPAYPQIALKRLSELAVHTTDETVADAVGDALTQLWDQKALQTTVRTILSSWFTSPQTHYVAAARRAFLHLADRTTAESLPLLVNHTDHTPDPWTLAGWRCALDGPATAPVQRAVNAWLDAALNHPTLRTTVLRTFTEAVFRSDADRTYLAERYLRLNQAAFGWQPTHAESHPGERSLLRDALVWALTQADPAAPVTARHAPLAQ
ncbi:MULTISPECIES: hypothetical protein [unclassified Streptomyces]|nr:MULTISPECIES: hypothetical protein [unclassified Streptomyces]AEN08002.1 hypothetical protein SACTE_0036 [Streptomyces sp. SirexAA-E]MYR67634.1 hypothetical protein [Streptomyces sp. SID4939]MYR98908.1 hypothetical protein [Streptomyces sp. SID4940]MYT62103.1 hypothetical protein [Streptomyces sp. SID8357]MYT68036.1 hypothetical protein [Streptomyces sp. SID8357]